MEKLYGRREGWVGHQMTLLVECLPSKQEDLGSDPQHPGKVRFSDGHPQHQHLKGGGRVMATGRSQLAERPHLRK